MKKNINSVLKKKRKTHSSDYKTNAEFYEHDDKGLCWFPCYKSPQAAFPTLFSLAEYTEVYTVYGPSLKSSSLGVNNTQFKASYVFLKSQWLSHYTTPSSVKNWNRWLRLLFMEEPGGNNEGPQSWSEPICQTLARNA